MQGWLAPLFGTALGLSVVAAGAALVLPEKPVVDLAPLVQSVLRAVRPPAAPAPRPEAPPSVEPDLQVAIEGLLRPRPAGVSNGTGFFVTSRGTLLTAEHVVRGCRSVRVMSSYMRPEAARVLAMDARQDVAVLEVTGLESPGWLAVAPPSRQAGRLLALGFPAGSMPGLPNETWAMLRNGAFERGAPVETDPARLVWFHSREVTFGYSGGPVVDVASGRVVAMTKAGFDPQRVGDVYGVPAAGLNIGPGAVPMLALLSQWAVREGVCRW